MTRPAPSSPVLTATLVSLALMLASRAVIRAEEASPVHTVPPPAPHTAEPAAPTAEPAGHPLEPTAHAETAAASATPAAAPGAQSPHTANSAGAGRAAPEIGPVAKAEAEKSIPAASVAKSTIEPQGPSEAEIRGLLSLGVSLTDRGDFEAAEIAYRQALNAPRIAPNEEKTALLGLAHMHRKQGALTKAVAIYERFLKDFPTDDRTPDALLELGRTLRDLGIYKTAIARFYSVINSTLKLPGEGFERYQVLDKTAKFEIAETSFVAGDFESAAKYYARLRLLDLAPADRARAHFKAGYSLRLLGDREAAVTTLRAYIDQWPDDENIPEARYLVAVTLRELKRPQEAFTATLELLRTEKSRIAADPRRWSYWQRRTGNQLANDFFETGDILNAHAIYSGLLELGVDAAWRMPITYQLALCYERLGILDRARSAYQTVVDTAGTSPSAELTELARMAAWRIEHLDWRDKIGQQVTRFFETNSGKPAAILAPDAVKTAATP